jgi:hypothetical protein
MGKIITVFEGSSCCEVWLQAVDYLFTQGAPCYNVVLGIEKPDRLSAADFQVQESVDIFLKEHKAKPISTVATTIFPASEYLHGGAREVFDEFPETYEKFREGWGTYAGRILKRSLPQDGEKHPISLLEQLIRKMKRQRETGKMRAVYEVSLIESPDLLTDIPIYDAATDSRLIRGGPCLSHLSFKLMPEGKVMLTAMYRYHFYIQRALGNLLGLAQLLKFVADEVGIGIGSLVCHSTYAVIDTEGGWTRTDVRRLIDECRQVNSPIVPNLQG